MKAKQSTNSTIKTAKPTKKPAKSTQILESSTYTELIIHPSHHLELFNDYIASVIKDAIELQDIAQKHNPFLITYENGWESVGFSIQAASTSAQSTQIIIRQNALDSSLISSLKAFSTTLSQAFDTNIGFCYHLSTKHNKDWIKAYQSAIKPITCARFYIRATWHTPLAKTKVRAESSIAPLQELIINPALAFGSGHHASTAMCLELLSNLNLSGKDMLDVGCGSGILSIAGAKMGAKAYACDSDSLAIVESSKNAKLNNIAFKHLWHGSLHNAPKHTPAHYDVIVANIVADVLIMLCEAFSKNLAKNGILILSGILSEYNFDIIRAFNDFIVLESKSSDGFIALKLAHKDK